MHKKVKLKNKVENVETDLAGIRRRSREKVLKFFHSYTQNSGAHYTINAGVCRHLHFKTFNNICPFFRLVLVTNDCIN